MRPLRVICKHLYDLRERKRTLTNELEEVKSEYSDVDRELQDALTAAGMERVTVDGHNYAPRSACIASVADSDKLVAWCHVHNLDPMYFFMQSVMKIRSYVRERLEDGGEIPDGLTDVLPISVIGITKAGTKNHGGV